MYNVQTCLKSPFRLQRPEVGGSDRETSKMFTVGVPQETELGNCALPSSILFLRCVGELSLSAVCETLPNSLWRSVKRAIHLQFPVR